MNLQGWRITTLVTCLIVVGLLVNFGLAGWNAPAIHQAIDATGRSSLILFAIAFTSSSLESFWPSTISRWTLRNRRWIGLSFASSHFIHLGLIVSMTVVFPDPFVSQQSMAQWVFGGLAYGFVFLMIVHASATATSTGKVFENSGTDLNSFINRVPEYDSTKLHLPSFWRLWRMLGIFEAPFSPVCTRRRVSSRPRRH